MSPLPGELAQLHFLRPWWLLGLLLIPALAWWFRSDLRRRSPWQDNVDAHLLPHLLADPDATPRRALARWMGWLAAALAVLAMAGPAWHKDEQPLWQSKAPLVIALDLSSSILARDLPPSRLPQARAKLATLLRERSGGQVALLAYAGDAHTVAPLTEDAANVALFLDALGPDLMPEDGQRSDRAIAWSRNLLQEAGFAHGDILLLTDHADAAALAAAASARLAGYRVSALGLGTAQGGSLETAAGVGQARLDAASLRGLASSGGGRYQTLTVDDADLRALGVLDPQAQGGASTRGEKIATWRDDGFWLLPPAMLLVLALFRRGGAMVAVLALALVSPLAPVTAWASDAQASNAQANAPKSVRVQQADRLAGKLWTRRDQADYARTQQGVGAYRKKDYSKAIEHFSGLQGADAQYNLGNALAMSGRLDDAIAAYDHALKLQPGMPDAVANRKLVEAARKRKPPPDGKGKSQQDQQSRQDQGKQNQGKQDQGKKDQGKQDSKSGQGSTEPGKQQQANPSKPGQPRSPQDAPQPKDTQQQQGRPRQQGAPQQQDAQQPQDAKAQTAADAAQRKRMQEALGKQAPAGKPDQQPRAKPETAEQRERKLANQAQLQRVPDDPGALLRARFRLEYERRQSSGGEP